MVKLKTLIPLVMGLDQVEPGSIVEVDEDNAERMIRKGYAEAAKKAPSSSKKAAPKVK